MTESKIKRRANGPAVNSSHNKITAMTAVLRIHFSTLANNIHSNKNTPMIADNSYDVAILCCGLAGLTLARQLLMKRPTLRVAIIDKRQFPVAETT